MEKITIEVPKVGAISDGYHTFDELYDHRITLYIALCRMIAPRGEYDGADAKYEVWCSPRHSDGSEMEGWFVLGISRRNGEQITYHLPNKYWEEVLKFSEYLEKAPEWDGHTSEDVLARIKNL